MANKRPAAALAAVAAVLLAGCASTAFNALGREDAAQAPALAAEAAGAPRAAGARPQELAAPQEPAAARPPAPEVQGQRLRVYSGTLELVVPAPQETAQQVIALVHLSEGYVESSSPDLIVLRVPAARFETVFERLGRLGEIRSRSIESADVTDQYRDLSRRIDVSERTRARLYTLLGRTANADERVRILREIRRLTEEIEGLKAGLATLDQQVKLSRIAIRLIARIAGGAMEARAVPFAWIARLDPLRPSTGPASSAVAVAVPADFAVFASGRRLSAESAEGTRLRAGAVANDPRGDTEFWHQALLYHLGPRYREAQPVAAGAFRGALFAGKDAQPFYYFVGLRVSEAEIVVVEAFFPDAAAKERRLPQVIGALEETKP